MPSSPPPSKLGSPSRLESEHDPNTETKPSLPPPLSTSSQNTETTTLINSITFNQDATWIAAATTTGIVTLTTAHLIRHVSILPFPGGISAVHPLFRTQILALIGGHFPPNKVMIFDNHKSSCIGELVFRSAVVSVRLRRDRIAAVLLRKILVYNFVNFEILNQIETGANPKGLCEVSCSANAANSFVLVCPGLQAGQVRVESYHGTCRKTRFIAAHNSKLNCLGLTMDGRYVATASTKGTLIRVFNALDGTLLREVRRGTDRAQIQTLAFSSKAQWLAASSDRGTIHVFSLKLDSGSPGVTGLQSPLEQPTSPRSPMSSISFMKGVLPKYFSSEWSLAQFHLKDAAWYIVAFGHQENTVVIVGMDGSFYRCGFDPVLGGEMKQLEHFNILKPEEPSES